MPVFSSGQSAAQVHDTWAALRTPDLIYAAGGGIMAHPHGPAGGVAALRAAWDAAMAGVPLAQAAREDAALAAAL
jgi:ribulose-bisphosphate carboxylase large chain